MDATQHPAVLAGLISVEEAEKSIHLAVKYEEVAETIDPETGQPILHQGNGGGDHAA